MWKMKSPEMSFLFCVMLLIQSVHAETLDVSTCDQANHRLLIVITALDCILLLIITPLGCCFILAIRSKDPKRGTSISTPRKLEEGKQLLRGRNDREEELCATIETMKKEKETLEKEKETLKEENESLRRRVEREAELRAMIETLKEEKDTLEKKNETLERENETLKEEKEKLKTENEKLKTENETLKMENEKLKTENETLKMENEKLKTENEKLKTENETLKEEKETLEKENETLKMENETLKMENETLKEEKETLEKENETLKEEKETLDKEKELMRVQRYKVDVTLDADTAHPRLQVSEDGESVKDTGVIRKVPSKEERFDSHTFLFAKEGYTSGRHYWEVDVGKKRNWNLGVAQENVARKETVALSPKNGFWVIGLADGQEYWAHSDPWTRLTVSGRPQKIGIFLDISSKKLSFISVHQKKVLYTFTSVSHHGQNVRLFPFFSTGSAATSSDTEPLRIARGFDDDDK